MAEGKTTKKRGGSLPKEYQEVSAVVADNIAGDANSLYNAVLQQFPEPEKGARGNQPVQVMGGKNKGHLLAYRAGGTAVRKRLLRVCQEASKLAHELAYHSVLVARRDNIVEMKPKVKKRKTS